MPMSMMDRWSATEGMVCLCWHSLVQGRGAVTIDAFRGCISVPWGAEMQCSGTTTLAARILLLFVRSGD
jgi:hypothetical protein